MVKELLHKIARQINSLDEDTLTAFLPQYKKRMMNFTPTKEWEEAVLIYFLINGLRIKNSQFNDKVKDFLPINKDGERCPSLARPKLRLLRAEEKNKSVEKKETSQPLAFQSGEQQKDE